MYNENILILQKHLLIIVRCQSFSYICSKASDYTYQCNQKIRIMNGVMGILYAWKMKMRTTKNQF